MTQPNGKEAPLVKNGKLSELTLSPSSIRRFENCPAGYLFSNLGDVLPKIDTSETKEVTKVGRFLHDIAEADFDSDFADKVLLFEKESKKKEVTDLQKRAVSREYMQYPSVTEVFLKIKVGKSGYFRGFADRLARDGDKVYVIDLKTTGNPNPYGDRRQVLAYGSMLYLLSKQLKEWLGDKPRNSIDDAVAARELAGLLGMQPSDAMKLITITDFKVIMPDQMVLLLDYIRVDKLVDFKLTEQEVGAYTNYLISTFAKVKSTMEDWLGHRNIDKIEHHPGECHFCPMKGVCKAYHIMINPHYDPVDPVEIATEDLIKELMDREYAQSLHDERVKALKRALIMRSQEGDEKVTEHCSIISGTTTSYPTKEVLSRIVPDILKKPVKNLQFQTMIDWDAVYKIVTSLVSVLVSDSLGQKNIPEQYLDDVEDLKIIYPKKPYLKVKR